MREKTTLRPVKVAELESMYVREGYRNRGRARRSWALLSSGPDPGSTASVGRGYASNERAIRFYKRSGFRPKSVVLEGAV